MRQGGDCLKGITVQVPSRQQASGSISRWTHFGFGCCNSKGLIMNVLLGYRQALFGKLRASFGLCP